MSTFINKTKLQIIAWRMSIFWFVLFSFNALGTAFLAASAGSVWSNLDTQAKATVIVAVFVNWSNTIMAYIKQAAKKVEEDLEAGHDLSPGDIISASPTPENKQP